MTQHPWRLVGLAILVALLGGGVATFFVQSAAQTDYQKSFLRVAATTAITVMVVTLLLQRAASLTGRFWLVPSVLVTAIVLATLLLRVETLSGEMIPQVTWRWVSKPVPPLRTAPTSPRASRSPSATAPESSSPNLSNPAAAAWPQLLGPNRNGSLEIRAWSVPPDSSSVDKLWDIGIGEGWSSFAVSGEIAVTLEQRADSECVTAYRLADGELLWLVSAKTRHSNPLGGSGPRSTPTIVGRLVYAQGATGQLWCVDLMTGELVWQRDLFEIAGWDQSASEAAIAWGRAGSPLLIDNQCVVPLGGPESLAERSLIALDASTGEAIWTAGEDQISYASPQLLTLGGMSQIVSVNEATITGHDPETGETLWTFPFEGQSNSGANCAAVIPAGEDRFVIGKGYGGENALVEVRSQLGTAGKDATWTATAVWQSSRVLKTKFNHPVIDGSIAYGISNGALEAVDLTDGRSLWQQPRGERSGQGQIIRAGQTLVVQNESGDVLFVEATGEEYRVQGRLTALQHKTWNIPTLAGDVLLVRNAQQAIAFRLPPALPTTPPVSYD